MPSVSCSIPEQAAVDTTAAELPPLEEMPCCLRDGARVLYGAKVVAAALICAASWWGGAWLWPDASASLASGAGGVYLAYLAWLWCVAHPGLQYYLRAPESRAGAQEATSTRQERTPSAFFAGPARKISQIFSDTFGGPAPAPHEERSERSRAGWLIKKPVSRRGLLWQSNRRRYIVFIEDRLSWHSTPHTAALGTIRIAAGSTMHEIEAEDGRACEITISERSGLQLTLLPLTESPEDRADFDKWALALRGAIQRIPLPARRFTRFTRRDNTMRQLF